MKLNKIIIQQLLPRFEFLQSQIRDLSPLVDIPKLKIPLLPKTPKQRGNANLKAIKLISTKTPSQLTEKEKSQIAKYTGWGGFTSTIKWNQKIKQTEFQITDDAILYEYYTPYALTYSIRDLILPLIEAKHANLLKVPQWKGTYLALEPSAGIGRFIEPLYTDAFQWKAIEPSIQSSKILMGLFPHANTSIMKFDEFTQQSSEILPTKVEEMKSTLIRVGLTMIAHKIIK